MARTDYINAGTQRRSVKGSRHLRMAGFPKPAVPLVVSIAPGAVAAHSVVERTVAVPGLVRACWQNGRHAIVSVWPIDLEPGLVALAPRVDADGHVVQPIENPTAAPIVGLARSWEILVFKKAGT